ncbi:hypothetical protein DIPPA_63702 [Diplonema papillatum]|nr:hypothetical protein DIPPA_63702 [Diplonema papillatum]
MSAASTPAPAVEFKYAGLQRYRPIGPVCDDLAQFGGTVSRRHLFGERDKSNVFVRYLEDKEPEGASALLKQRYGLKFQKQVKWATARQRRGDTTLHVSLTCKQKRRRLTPIEVKFVAHKLCDELSKSDTSFNLCPTARGEVLPCVRLACPPGTALTSVAPGQRPSATTRVRSSTHLKCSYRTERLSFRIVCRLAKRNGYTPTQGGSR